jgi:hypothetical protein
MKPSLRSVLLSAVALATALAPAQAVGPVDGEVTALYWESETEFDAIVEGSGAPGARADLWFWDRWGASAALFEPSPEGALDGSDLGYANIDLKWRFLSASQNNFLAIGAGWERFTLDGVTEGTSDGVRVLAEGRVGIVKILYFYGRAAYLPELSDLDTGTVVLTNGKGQEGEAGLQLKPLPFLQIFAGYRVNETEFDTPAGPLELKNEGPVVGLGVNF